MRSRLSTEETDIFDAGRASVRAYERCAGNAQACCVSLQAEPVDACCQQRRSRVGNARRALFQVAKRGCNPADHHAHELSSCIARGSSPLPAETGRQQARAEASTPCRSGRPASAAGWLLVFGPGLGHGAERLHLMHVAGGEPAEAGVPPVRQASSAGTPPHQQEPPGHLLPWSRISGAAAEGLGLHDVPGPLSGSHGAMCTARPCRRAGRQAATQRLL